MDRLLRAQRWLRAFPLIVILCGALPALALDPDVSLHDYRHDTWRAKDGTPGNGGYMVQSKDGWLWISNYSGLTRFDGLTFEHFVAPSGQRLRGHRISVMHAAENGDLLVAYSEGGFDVIRNGDLVPLPNAGQAPKEVVYDLLADADGSVWMATGQGLVRYAGGAWQSITGQWGLPAKAATEVTLDRSRQLWTAVAGTWYKLDRDKQRFVATGRPDGFGTFYSPDGQMWQENGKRIERVSPTLMGAPVAWRQAERNANGLTSMFDRDGNLWLLHAPNGVVRIRKRDIPDTDSFDPSRLPSERLDQPWQLSSVATEGMVEDREGNVWVWTNNGLERFRHQRIRTVPLPPAVELVNTYADAAGAIWAGGLNVEGLWQLSPRSTAPHLSTQVRGIAALGRDGALVSSTRTGIQRRYADHTEQLPLPACRDLGTLWFDMLVEDHVSTWLVVRPCGAFRHINGAWHAASEYGPPNGVKYLAAAPDGAVWYTLADGSAWRLEDGKAVKMAVSDLATPRFLDVQQEVLIGGAEGLAVLKGGGFEPLQAVDAGALHFVAGIMITADGDRWIHSLAGLVHVKGDSWKASMRDPRIPLRTEILDAYDGYPGATTGFLPLPNGAIDAQGRLWFVGTLGVGVLDPHKRYRNPVPPQVRITGFRADNRQLAPQAEMRLQRPASTVEIRFAALNLTMPERMTVLYRLEGEDHEWQSAGTARNAVYRNLAPGSYRFRIKAANADGVWSEHDASMTFYMAPRFTQTIWFYLLCVMGVASLGYLAYLLRMRQVVGRMNAMLAARLMERERIARALHDSWLQNVHGLVLSFAGVSRQLPASSPERRRMEELLTQADGVLVDGRNSVMGLRAGAVRSHDIERAFTSLGERLQRDHGPDFTLRIRGAMRPLDSVAWEEIYYVGYEALHNAYLHAQARRITMTLDYGVEAFVLLVRDDGQGLPDEVLRDGQRAGHWGLTGMRERAELAGGELELRSAGAHGTEVGLRIPAPRAYVSGTRAGWLSRLRARLRWR